MQLAVISSEDEQPGKKLFGEIDLNAEVYEIKLVSEAGWVHVCFFAVIDIVSK